MTTNPTEEVRFLANSLVLLDVLKRVLVKLHANGFTKLTPGIIELGKGIIKKLDKVYLIEGFIKNSHTEYWNAICRRDEKYFEENSSAFFSHLPIGNTDIMRDVFRSKDKDGECVVSQQMKDTLFKIIGSLIKISIKYVHRKREPYARVTEEGILNSYAATFMPEVDLKSHCDDWGLVLVFPQN